MMNFFSISEDVGERVLCNSDLELGLNINSCFRRISVKMVKEMVKVYCHVLPFYIGDCITVSDTRFCSSNDDKKRNQIRAIGF